jgi:hypothetical protein
MALTVPTAPTLTSTAVSVPHVRYTVTFTVGAPLGNNGTITITGPPGTVMPNGASIHDTTAGTTFSRSATRINSNTGLTINLCCSDAITAGDSVTVTLDNVTNGSTLGPNSLSVATSAETSPVASPSYDLTAQENVMNVTAPTVSSTAIGVPHVRYTFSFQTSSGNGGLVQPGTITITAPAGTTLPSSATIHDNNSGANFGRSGTVTNSGATLTVSLCCSDAINAGDVLVITLDNVTNASSLGPHTIDVSTSTNPTPVTSGTSYTLTAQQPITNVSAPTLSSNAGGVPHVRYSFSFQTSTGNGGMVAPGTIKIDAPAGTTLPSSATIHDNNSGANFGRSGTLSNGNATLTLSLCCSDAIAAGDVLVITLDNVTNAPTGSGYTFGVSTSTNPQVVQSQPYSLTAPEQLTGATGVSLSSAAGGIQHVRYSFGFTASGSTGGMVAPGTIKIDAPPGTVLPSSGTIHDATSGATFGRAGALSNGNATLTLSLCCSDLINAGDALTITLDDVTNPATGGPYTISVATSSNPSPVATSGYSLSAPQQVTSVTPVTTSTDSRGVLSDAFSFKTSVPTGGLVPPGTITVNGPPGTVMPTFANLRDDTTGATFTRSGTRSNGNTTLTLSLCCSDTINPGDTVTVSLPGIVNPAGGAGPFTVSTSSDTGSVTTPPFTQPPPPGPPAPVIGKKATAAVEKGLVLVKLPGKKGFVRLTGATSIPVGSVLDTTKGQVGLTFATSTTGTSTQRGSFSQGQFQVAQARKNPLTTMSMVGGGLDGCNTKLPKGGARKPIASAARKHRRTLFSSVKGHFRTRGRNSTATVRGTKWSVTDTCAGTKTTVTQGTVVVRDLRLHRNITVRAGHSYLAHAQLLKKKKH